MSAFSLGIVAVGGAVAYVVMQSQRDSDDSPPPPQKARKTGVEDTIADEELRDELAPTEHEAGAELEMIPMDVDLSAPMFVNTPALVEEMRIEEEEEYGLPIERPTLETPIPPAGPRTEQGKANRTNSSPTWLIGSADTWRSQEELAVIAAERELERQRVAEATANERAVASAAERNAMKANSKAKEEKAREDAAKTSESHAEKQRAANAAKAKAKKAQKDAYILAIAEAEAEMKKRAAEAAKAKAEKAQKEGEEKEKKKAKKAYILAIAEAEAEKKKHAAEAAKAKAKKAQKEREEAEKKKAKKAKEAEKATQKKWKK